MCVALGVGPYPCLVLQNMREFSLFLPDPTLCSYQFHLHGNDSPWLQLTAFLSSLSRVIELVSSPKDYYFNKLFFFVSPY